MLLSAGQLVSTLVGSAGYLLIMTGRPKLELANTVLFVLLKVALGVVLIPRWGLLGAAVSTGLSVALLNLTRLIEVRILTGVHPYSTKYLKLLSAGLVSGLGGFLLEARLRPEMGPFALTVLLSGAIIACYLLVLSVQGIEPEDRRVVANLFSRVRFALLRR